ncbi:DUF262 domain-containing protein [Tenacibaculum finnmarkense]|uniref:DUF262 domain-containing protein n=1 Tax=Tenacibaculum finnmarkense TaxID=2781243 RepID=UPI001EFB9BA3|nr:DUF262 domain-containing protein [Tenacibaculum finnmarkense]MCG8208312.1 DUF262 domain-containing protein [Tenacibaculum finnmarkense genomovar finnmarkense]MCG8724279.1 DUF262 domain-containing protein [Tenacibaculum finnmarkense]MCG8742614.1 DUF262 domain-containing protein [Tenacibaculum finnmarkense]MCG8765992.1 DUF262 domain-containing protein [Tenacibaculum finnmarkense]MCG8778953.1 DUF262 domain-containing protein [Tenacibaculum finnmarkense]
METKQTVSQYIGKNTNKYFNIPAYQRGYKWGELNENSTCAASILVDDILSALENKKENYFIQGVTVYENGSDVYLIDGQQRTTTLFVLLNLLFDEQEKKEYLFFKDDFKLKYHIRKATEEYLEASFLNGTTHNAKSQDQSFLHQASQEMQKILHRKNFPIEDFRDYLLNNVVLFYIEIPQEQATKAFTMLNGSKAFMTTDELVKSSFLCEASKVEIKEFSSNSLEDTLGNMKAQIGADWQITMLRSRYARQWDKWMYWWNQAEVKTFFQSAHNPMGWLLTYFYNTESSHSSYSNEPNEVASTFKNFQNDFIKDSKTAKANFERLRKLQKTFEDIYNDSIVYNYLGLALIYTKLSDHSTIIVFFIENFKNKNKIKKYTLLLLIDITYKEGYDKEGAQVKLDNLLNLISLPDVYNSDAKEPAFRVLFLLNVLATNDRGIKFEFYYEEIGKGLVSFYKNRSLEHIWPKSKIVYQKEGNSFSVNEKNQEVFAESGTSNILFRNKFKEGTSEHCIGNLLFLHKNDNSVFSAKVPEDKKMVYFNLEKPIYSRNLLHTMSAFAVTEWSKEKVFENVVTLKNNTITKVENLYKEILA